MRAVKIYIVFHQIIIAYSNPAVTDKAKMYKNGLCHWAEVTIFAFL